MAEYDEMALTKCAESGIGSITHWQSPVTGVDQRTREREHRRKKSKVTDYPKRYGEEGSRSCGVV